MMDGQMVHHDTANTGKYELESLGGGTGCLQDDFSYMFTIFS